MLKRVARSKRGQSLVEFALILPSMLLLTVGSIDFGRAFYETVAIQGAADAGSLMAYEWRRGEAPGSSPAEADAAVRAAIIIAAAPFVTLTSGDITLNVPWTAGAQYTITVTKGFKFWTPVLSDVLGGATGLNLRAQVTGRHNCPC